MAIKSFRSNKLKTFWQNGDASKLQQGHVNKVKNILTAIDASHHPQHLKSIFQHRFDSKKGNAEGVYSIKVNGNFRITFEIEEEGAILLDYLDYHGKTIPKK